MADVRSPIFIRLGNRGRAQETPRPEFLQNISISDIVVTGAAHTSSISGIPGHPIRQVTLKNIRISSRGGGAAELADRNVPEMERGYPDAERFGELPAYGLFCRHVETLMLDNLSFHLEKSDARPALVADQVAELDLHAILAEPPSGDQPAIWLSDVQGCFLQGLRARLGTRTFIKLSGAQTARIHAVGNDFSGTENAFHLADEVRKEELRQEANLLPR